MMKKKISLVLAFALCLLSLSGCGKNTEEKPEAEVKNYKDGVYTVQWAEDTDGWTEYMTVKIENNALSIFEFDAKDRSGNFKSEDADAAQGMIDANKAVGLPELNPQKAYAQVMESFKAAGELDKMEAVAGATESMMSFKALVSALLETNALTGDTEPCLVPAFADGTYTATESAADEDGYKERLVVTIADGVITVDEFDGVNADGGKKTADAELIKKMKTDPNKFYPAIIESYKTAGSANGMETVAGATRSTTAFKKLLGAIEKSAHYRGEKDITLSPYVDGVYRAEMSDFDAHGWKDYLVLSVHGGEVSVVELGSKNKDGKLKSEDSAYKDAMIKGNTEAGLAETYPEQYEKDIASSFAAADGDVLVMENVAGATASCNNFKLMAGELLGFSAVKGNTQTLMVAPLTAEEAAK